MPHPDALRNLGSQSVLSVMGERQLPLSTHGTECYATVAEAVSHATHTHTHAQTHTKHSRSTSNDLCYPLHHFVFQQLISFPQ